MSSVGVGVSDEPWIEPELLNGWKNVEERGDESVEGHPDACNPTVFILPDGYRPEEKSEQS